jgi:hypothetical protein
VNRPSRFHVALVCFWALSWAIRSAYAGDVFAGKPESQGGVPAIAVEAGDWGHARPADIELVLYAAAWSLQQFAPERKVAPVRVVPGSGDPQVFYQKNARSEYVVRLTAKDRRWAQYAYQFAHEYCHILARFDNKDIEHGQLVARHQWFEETLCELSSVYVLRRMAKAWEDSPPVPEWRDYAPALAEFADIVLSKEARDEAAKEDLAGWYSRHQHALAIDPRQWKRNEVGAYLLLPFFETSPASWAAIGYLNSERAAASASFAQYLQNWRRALPPTRRGLADQIIDAFGLGDREL